MLAVGAAMIVSPAVLVAVLSGGPHPNRDYAPFADCPLGNPTTDICIFARTESGELTIGKKTIPITTTMTLQGGVHQDEATDKQEFIGAQDGNTLSRTPQVVPGGLVDIIAPKPLSKTSRKRFYELVAGGVTDVTATTELAGPASSIGVSTPKLIEAKGIGLSLPVKVKLSGPLLGESCYIGSNARPIVIRLTTGRADATGLPPSHEPLTGKPGHAKFRDEYNLTTIKEESLLSDPFAAPRAEGCGGNLSWRVDPALDAGLGLPVGATGNEALFNDTLREANAAAVKASR